MMWKRFACTIVVLSVGLGSFETAIAEDSVVPIEVQTGDAISAEVFNDLFRRVAAVSAGFRTSSELEGSWSCRTFSTERAFCLPGFNTSDGGLLSHREQNITFSCTGSSCTWQASLFNPISCMSGSDCSSGGYEVHGGVSLFTFTNNCKSPLLTMLYRNGIDKFSFINTGQSGEFVMVQCDRKNVPPKAPSNLTATAQQSVVQLSWSDNSDDESGFRIESRKEGENWSVAGEVGADQNSFNHETSPTADKLYRVFAVNAFGDSVGSNVVLTTSE